MGSKTLTTIPEIAQDIDFLRGACDSLRRQIYTLFQVNASIQPASIKNATDAQIADLYANFKIEVDKTQKLLDEITYSAELGPLGCFEVGKVYKYVEYPTFDQGFSTTGVRTEWEDLDTAEKGFTSVFYIPISGPSFGKIPGQFWPSNISHGFDDHYNAAIRTKDYWYQEMLCLRNGNTLALDLGSGAMFWGRWYRLEEDTGDATPVSFCRNTPEDPTGLRESPINKKHMAKVIAERDAAQRVAEEAKRVAKELSENYQASFRK